MIATDIKIALKSLRATRLRTALTVLGVIIGVASVTMVLALGEGAKQLIAQQASSLGPNSLTIRSGKAVRDLRGNVLSYNFLAALGATTLNTYDLGTIQQTPHVLAAPIMSIIGSVGSNQKSTDNTTSIIATTPDLLNVMQFKLRSGQFVTSDTESNTVVIGNGLAEKLLGSDTAIGQNIFLRGQAFTVVGILTPYALAANFDDPFDFNNSAFISLPAGQAFNQGIPNIQQIDVRITDNAAPEAIIASLHQKLLANHNGQDDFTILSPQDTVQITDSLLRFLTLLISAVATISLVVGGIGIMNIMLVSVAERTREIGIRKTVGATNGQILRQFIIEALLMSLTGGIFGLLAAYGAAFVIGTYVGFMPVITLWIVAIALGMSLVTGVIFGIAPAIRAARKNPIEALRVFQ